MRLLLKAAGINYEPLDESWLADCMWSSMDDESKQEFAQHTGRSKEPVVNALGY